MRKIIMSLLLLQIIRGAWFIEPLAAAAYKPLVLAVLKSDENAIQLLMTDGKKKNKALQPYCLDGGAPTLSFGSGVKLGDAKPGSIAITPVSGPVMKQDYCGSPGTKSMLQFMQQADANPNIVGHILHIDTPGGTVNGTFNFSDAIKNLSKPVVAFVDEMACSAGYLIASGAKEIIACNDLCRIGSIGTYMSFDDDSEMKAAAGIKTIEVYASASTEKNKAFKDARAGNTDTLLNEMVDPYNIAFMDAVSKNRYGKSLDKANTLNGQTYMSADALKYGLIDGIGDMNYAVKRVNQLAKKS